MTTAEHRVSLRFAGVPTESDPTPARLGLVSGFTLTSACWGRFGERLAGAADLVPIDAPGHGHSADVDVDLWGGGAMVADRLGRGDLLGYSLGGRLAQHAALSRPDAVERLVLLSTTAGIADPAERAERRRSDEALATRLESIGVDAFVDEWTAQPMFAALPSDPVCDAARRSNTVEGLARSLRRCGTGTQEPLWDRLAGLDIPTLVIAGGRDDKFAELARRLAAGIPGSELVIIAGAGHACHSERPDDTADAVLGWLRDSRRVAPSPS